MKRIIYMSIIAIVIASCDNSKNKNSTEEEVKKESNEAIDNYAAEEKQALIKDFISKRDNTKTRIGQLNKKLINIKLTQKKSLEEKVNELEAKLKKLDEKISELNNSSGEAYNEIRVGLDSAMEEIAVSLEAAEKELR